MFIKIGYNVRIEQIEELQIQILDCRGSWRLHMRHCIRPEHHHHLHHHHLHHTRSQSHLEEEEEAERILKQRADTEGNIHISATIQLEDRPVQIHGNQIEIHSLLLFIFWFSDYSQAIGIQNVWDN